MYGKIYMCVYIYIYIIEISNLSLIRLTIAIYPMVVITMMIVILFNILFCIYISNNTSELYQVCARFNSIILIIKNKNREQNWPLRKSLHQRDKYQDFVPEFLSPCLSEIESWPAISY